MCVRVACAITILNLWVAERDILARYTSLPPSSQISISVNCCACACAWVCVCVCECHDFSHSETMKRFHVPYAWYGIKEKCWNCQLFRRLESHPLLDMFSIVLLNFNRFRKTLFQLFLCSINTLYTFNTINKLKKWEKYCFDFKHKIWCINAELLENDWKKGKRAITI